MVTPSAAEAISDIRAKSVELFRLKYDSTDVLFVVCPTPFKFAITRILLVENNGVIEAVKPEVITVPVALLTSVLVVALTTCNTDPVGKAALGIDWPLEAVVIKVPLVAGKSNTVVPAIAGSCSVILPLVEPNKIIDIFFLRALPSDRQKALLPTHH